MGDHIKIDDESSRSGYSVAQVEELYQDAAVRGGHVWADVCFWVAAGTMAASGCSLGMQQAASGCSEAAGCWLLRPEFGIPHRAVPHCAIPTTTAHNHCHCTIPPCRATA